MEYKCVNIKENIYDLLAGYVPRGHSLGGFVEELIVRHVQEMPAWSKNDGVMLKNTKIQGKKKIDT